MATMRPIIIVGSGMAGYTLAREFRKLNKEQSLIMITTDDASNYAKPTLSNALAGNKAPDQIALGDAEKMRTQLDMTILTETWVKAINAEQHQIEIETSGQLSTLDYEKLVLAVGANPIRLAISGDGADDIFVVNNLNDYKAHTATAFQENLEQAGIQFALATTVDKVVKIKQQGADIDYEVTLSNGQRFVVDVVLSAIGLQPNINLAKSSKIHTSRGIIANSLMETNQPDIYAVGDCAEVQGTLLPYVMPIMQQARALAKTLNGESTHVHYPAMPVAVKTPAAPLTVLPAPTDVEVNWETEEFDDGMLAKAIDQESTLRGFVLLGATAGKQRLSLAKLVPDLIPAQSS